MLVLALVLSLPLGWLGTRLQKARRQQEAIKKIEALGAVCYYDWESLHDDWERIPRLSLGPAPKPSEPKWITDVLGGDFFWTITDIDWSPVASNPSDAEKNLLLLKEFPELEWLWLDGGEITGEWIAYLGTVSTLRYLIVPKADIGDADLVHLSRLTNLEELVLTGCSRVTNDGLVHLSSLKKMTLLSLSGTGVEDAGMEHIQELDALRWLVLTGSNISDEGLAYLKNCRSLEILGIDFTGVTDAGLAHLAGMESLAELDLSCTDVTDEGLKHLYGLKLDRLALCDIGVTADGVRRIEEAIPGCSVSYIHAASTNRTETSTAADPFETRNPFHGSPEKAED